MSILLAISWAWANTHLVIFKYYSTLFRVAAILQWKGPKLQCRRITEFYYCLPSLTSVHCSIWRVALLHRVTQRARSWPVFAFCHSLRNFLHLPVGGGFLSSWPADHQSMRTEAEAMTETALWETASANLFNFIPEQREYIGLGVVAGESPNLHQTAHSYQKAPSTSRSYLWKHGPITMFLVYV